MDGPGQPLSITARLSWYAASPGSGSVTAAASGVTSTAATVVVHSTYTSWKNLCFGSNANNDSISGPNADPSGDGVPNLLCYAIGANPLGPYPATELPVAGLVNDPVDGKLHLTLTATLDATTSGLSFTGQVSADLRTWNSGSTYVQVVSDTTVGNVRTLILRDSTALGGSSNHYIRLQVTGQ